MMNNTYSGKRSINDVILKSAKCLQLSPPVPKIPFMANLSGVAAETRLAEAWEEIFGQDPASQQIIHVLTRPSGYPAWLTGFTPFEAWMHNGCDANDEIWRNFAEIAAPWPYIHNARRAVAAGISNVRIFVLERDSMGIRTTVVAVSR